MQNIILVSYGHFELDFLKKIASDVSREFHLPVSIKEGFIDLDNTPDMYQVYHIHIDLYY